MSPYLHFSQTHLKSGRLEGEMYRGALEKESFGLLTQGVLLGAYIVNSEGSWILDSETLPRNFDVEHVWKRNRRMRRDQRLDGMAV